MYLIQVLLMNTHNISFYWEIGKVFIWYSSLLSGATCVIILIYDNFRAKETDTKKNTLVTDYFPVRRSERRCKSDIQVGFYSSSILLDKPKLWSKTYYNFSFYTKTCCEVSSEIDKWGNFKNKTNICIVCSFLTVIPLIQEGQSSVTDASLCTSTGELLRRLSLPMLTLVLLNPDMSCLCKQCRSRSVGFWRSQLIWICTVCLSVFEFVSTIWIK